jgi:hypothetical protein
MTSGQNTANATRANFIVSVAPHSTRPIGKIAITGIALKNSITPITLLYAKLLRAMSVPMTSAAPAPIASPIAQPSRVCPIAVQPVAVRAWSHSADAVCVIEGNSSARITPAALSHCHRPSAAASTPSRSPYLSAKRRVVTGSPSRVP